MQINQRSIKPIQIQKGRCFLSMTSFDEYLPKCVKVNAYDYLDFLKSPCNFQIYLAGESGV